MNGETVVIGGNEPIFGLVFGLDGERFDNDGGKTFYSVNMVHNEASNELSIGLDMFLDGWDRRDAQPDNPVAMFDGDLRLRSTGDGTKQLAKTWSHMLGLPYRTPLSRIGKLLVDAVPFGSDPNDLRSAGFKGKFWLGEQGDVEECQVFLRVLPALNQAWFGEKSPQDTRNFIEWLTRLG
jgi:hypothetical protein